MMKKLLDWLHYNKMQSLLSYGVLQLVGLLFMGYYFLDQRLQINLVLKLEVIKLMRIMP